MDPTSNSWTSNNHHPAHKTSRFLKRLSHEYLNKFELIEADLTNFLGRWVDGVENVDRTNHGSYHRYLPLRLFLFIRVSILPFFAKLFADIVHCFRFVIVDVQRRVIQPSVSRYERRWVSKVTRKWTVQAVRAIEIESLGCIRLSSTLAQHASIIRSTEVSDAGDGRLLGITDVLRTLAWTTKKWRRQIS